MTQEESIQHDVDRAIEEAQDAASGYFTIADVYRRARELYNLNDFEFGERDIKAPNKLCIEYAVNVARWMPSIPRLDYTPYTTTTLTWKFNNHFLIMEFFLNRVRVLKFDADNPQNSYEFNQCHSGNIQIDMLFTALYQVSIEAGMPVDNQPQPWDEFEGIAVPDLDMNEIERRERAAAEEFAKAFQEEMKRREENGEYEQVDLDKMYKQDETESSNA